MFLAGLSYNYVDSIEKNIKNLLSIWFKWLFFLIIFYFILIVFFPKEFYLSGIINIIFFKAYASSLKGVYYSVYWFITTYFKVTVISTIVIYYLKKCKKIEIKYLLLFPLFSNLRIINLDSYFYIYSFIYLLGYYSYDKKIKRIKSFLLMEFLIIFLTCLIFWLKGFNITDLQRLKFPPTLEYLFVSMPSILLVWYLKDKLVISSKNFLNYIGKNSLFFFFTQGISSSILFFIEPLININIYIKFIILFIINLLIALVLGVFINELYRIIMTMLSRIKVRKNEVV